ncbi:alpha/beta fold hydrolase [Novosphingobium album (ex Liu et al. 2023)]|uniref:Alpha/beta hydrolase n=1 Tax=Novosphingobium album (ex Liu et al. 2023) TaxID=3031130 RepID=A0ABT5WSC4_9SPHN|nr:alpha/beta hydrolase [Novosphingobium album (ex Liu et al. 2023)]MDE8652956.1 alpha/beta hydrolase [Novosphingobium album (ex Liu et al. 2023)]
MTRYEDRFWTSRDGLKLHYRDYAGPDHGEGAGRPPIVCLHGLARNARDFEALAERLSPAWRVLCPEMRGRGESEYARDAATYNPMQYVDDLSALLDELGIARIVAVGTSLGGLMTMILAMLSPGQIAGAVINDVGPWLEPAGLTRIKDYVGQGRSFPTWVHAARALEETQGTAHPGYDLSDWIAMAKRVMTLSSNGRIVFDYDMKIAEPFVGLDVHAQPDLWPGIEALAGKPVLIVRGALSDLLSEETLAGMRARLPDADVVTVPGVGHAPSLSEPEVEAAIDRLLAKVA